MQTGVCTRTRSLKVPYGLRRMLETLLIESSYLDFSNQRHGSAAGQRSILRLSGGFLRVKSCRIKKALIKLALWNNLDHGL